MPCFHPPQAEPSELWDVVYVMFPRPFAHFQSIFKSTIHNSSINLQSFSQRQTRNQYSMFVIQFYFPTFSFTQALPFGSPPASPTATGKVTPVLPPPASQFRSALGGVGIKCLFFSTCRVSFPHFQVRHRQVFPGPTFQVSTLMAGGDLKGFCLQDLQRAEKLWQLTPLNPHNSETSSGRLCG